MASKIEKIEKNLVDQYVARDPHSNEYISECTKDYDGFRGYCSTSSMCKAFVRGMKNSTEVFEAAIKKWAKKNNLNASQTLYQIRKELDDEHIKLI